jgi:hypothetical protein
MKRTIDVVFDGEVLRPVEPLDLEPNTRYRVTIEEQPTPSERETEEQPPLMTFLDLAQDLDLPTDFAEQHDHYLYGTPKR